MHPPQQQPQQWPPAPPQQYGPPMQQGPPPPPPRKRGKGVAFAVVGGAVIVLGLLGGLVKLTGGDAVAKPTVSASRTPGVRVKVAEPTRSQERAYLASLEGIDPGLVVNTDRAMRRAGRICDYLLNGMGGSKYSLPEYTVLELSGGHATINEVQAKRVIQAVAVWCRPL